MGLITNYIAYRVGKRVAGRESPENFASDPECIYYSECVTEGGCGSRGCFYEETSD